MNLQAPIKAKYTELADCQACIDLGWYDKCIDCEKNRTKIVNILEFNMGAFGSNALILHKDGKLETVPISQLKIIGQEEDNNFLFKKR